MKITDCFEDAKAAVAQSQSTLSKRSIARAPGRNTRRLVNAFQVVGSLKKLLSHVDNDCPLERKIQQARSVASGAVDVVSNQPAIAGEQMRICSRLVMEAEALYLDQHPVAAAIQSCPPLSNLEEHPPTVALQEEPEIASAEDVTAQNQPNDDRLVECGVHCVHADEEGDQ